MNFTAVQSVSRFSVRILAGTVAILVGISLYFPRARAQSESRVEHASEEPQNWLTYYGNYAGWSYSTLNQINRSNVHRLAPVWAFPAGEVPANLFLKQGLEAAPLVVDGTLYLVGPQNNVYAIDAATGKLNWQYTHDWSHPAAQISPKGARGLAYNDGRIYMGTQDDRVVALDVKDGKVIWNIAADDPSKCFCSITSPPLFVKGKVITGVAGGDGPMRGYLQAFDAETGKLLWRFNTIPAPGEPGSETWPGGDTWKVGGGATWITGTYDPELNLIFWGTGNAFPDYVGDDRAGSNLYSASLLALNPDTGKLKWHFQETPHDVYDFDAALEPVLLDLHESGLTRKVILHSGKNGYAYIIDRQTGKFIRGFPYVETLNWSKGLDQNGQPIEARIPDDKGDFLFCPGSHGGNSFNHSSYSPRTGWWYTTDQGICNYIKHNSDSIGIVNPKAPPHLAAFDPATGKREWIFPTKYFNQSSLLSTAGDLVFAGDLDGSVFALDARTGKELWSFRTGGRIAAPPVTFSVNGRQYVAISSGGGSAREAAIPLLWPESRGHLPQPTATLFVFALPEAVK